jgi:preprotein translocase SecE subunit
MENESTKWVTGSFAVATLIAWFILHRTGQYVVGAYDLEVKFRSIGMALQVGTGVVSLLGFIILLKNERANQYMHEVVAELSRVTWPKALETRNATIVVIVMVIISGIILAGLDAVWTEAIKRIIG